MVGVNPVIPGAVKTKFVESSTGVDGLLAGSRLYQYGFEAGPLGLAVIVKLEGIPDVT